MVGLVISRGRKDKAIGREINQYTFSGKSNKATSATLGFASSSLAFKKMKVETAAKPVPVSRYMDNR